ncbi:MAG: BRCT domain-containing protein, partial [Planctomycetota bacterium]
SHKTLGYLARRGWRYLRRIGQTFPAIYPDVATDFLIHYEGHSTYYFSRSWIFNQVFFHDAKKHRRTKFNFGYRSPKSLRRYRAFDELWKRSPRPLFTLLEQASAQPVIEFAAESLKSDFRAVLREVEPSWVARLASVRKPEIDSFVVWILSNVPKFEQAKFRELGLHDAVLSLFDSDSEEAQKYAATYARTHARDLPVERLIGLANSYHDDIYKLAVDLLQSRDPRKEIGLEAWGKLLGTDRGYDLAEEALRKHFGSAELTPEWFSSLLADGDYRATQFVESSLLKLHSRDKLGWSFFADVLDTDPDWDVARLCCKELAEFDLAEIPTESLQRLLINVNSRSDMQRWVREGKLKAAALDAEFLKTIAFRPSYESSPLIESLKQTEWGKYRLNFDEELATNILSWLKDVRQFLPDDLGFEWLLTLVQRSEPLYHDFAVETLTKSFLPADFAPGNEQTEESKDTSDDSEINVDLGGAAFVFTGKLATMTRGEAQGKVTTAGGANSNSVTKKLDYLIIGDEGSPLYGQGRKGSKQTKAESLNEQGAEIRIMSETAFLQMLAGEQREFSADTVLAGCERLWSMMCDAESPDEPLARFARTYIRHHHNEICLAETDRPVDPGAEMPAEFMTFDRFLPLFHDRRRPLREFALEFARWEFADWAPPIEGIVDMCDAHASEVRDFVATAMTCEDSPEHRRYRIDPTILTPDAAYSFCESRNAETRRLGMKLIDMHPRLRVPDELFRLTESPDSNIRTFAIRTFWQLYRERGITGHWEPTPPPKSSIKKRKQTIDVGPGPPQRPDKLPAEFEALESLLRRILFTVPPGRPPKTDRSAADSIVKLKPPSARMAKLNLVQTLRDIALEDAEFAPAVFPLLSEFMGSRGKSEHDACLLAVTRLRHHYPELTT